MRAKDEGKKGWRSTACHQHTAEQACTEPQRASYCKVKPPGRPVVYQITFDIVLTALPGVNF